MHLRDTIGTDRTIYPVENDTDLGDAAFAKRCLQEGVEVELSEGRTAVVHPDQIRHFEITGA